MTELAFLYLTTTGHRSGNPHEIEIWYVEHEGCYFLVSEKNESAHWVRNIRADLRRPFPSRRDLCRRRIHFARHGNGTGRARTHRRSQIQNACQTRLEQRLGRSNLR